MLVSDEDSGFALLNDEGEFVRLGLRVDDDKNCASPECGPNANNGFVGVVGVNDDPVATFDLAIEQNPSTAAHVLEQLPVRDGSLLCDKRGLVRQLVRGDEERISKQRLKPRF